MPSWGNGDGPAGEGVQYDNEVIDGGVHPLTVNGLTTCNGGLTVDPDAEIVGGLTVASVNCQGGMQVNAALHVGDNLQLHDLENGGAVNTRVMDTNLELNTWGEGADVIVSHPDDAANPLGTLVVQCPRIRVGNQWDGGQAGHIDANGQDEPMGGLALNIGTQQRTRNVIIGRPDLVDPEVNVTVNSHLLVGNDPALMVGRIDAAPEGAANRNLEIGGQNSTADLQLGRQNQTVHLAAPLNANGNAILLDAAGTLSIVANADGHGWGASADFVVAGNVVGWFDAAGIHVQPPAP